MNIDCPLKILIVEDNPIAARQACIMMNKTGHQPELAPDGNTALKMFEKNIYHLILLDIGLPDLDGYTVAENIRTLQKKLYQDSPVVVIGVTAHINTKLDHESKRIYFDNFLEKPLTFEKSERIISDYFHVK